MVNFDSRLHSMLNNFERVTTWTWSSDIDFMCMVSRNINNNMVNLNAHAICWGVGRRWRFGLLLIC